MDAKRGKMSAREFLRTVAAVATDDLMWPDAAIGIWSLRSLRGEP